MCGSFNVHKYRCFRQPPSHADRRAHATTHTQEVDDINWRKRAIKLCCLLCRPIYRTNSRDITVIFRALESLEIFRPISLRCCSTSAQPGARYMYTMTWSKKLPQHTHRDNRALCLCRTTCVHITGTIMPAICCGDAQRQRSRHKIAWSTRRALEIDARHDDDDDDVRARRNSASAHHKCASSPRTSSSSRKSQRCASHVRRSHHARRAVLSLSFYVMYIYYF